MYINFTLTTWHGEKSSAAMISSVLLLILLVFGILKARNNRLIRIFNTYTASIFFWAFGIYQLTVATNDIQGLFWARFLNMAALFIPSTFFHFVTVLINPTSKNKGALAIRVGYLISFLFALTSYSKYFISGTIHVPSFYYYPNAGILLRFSACFFVFFVGWGLVKLFQAYATSTGLRRNQFKYVFTAYLFKVAGGAQTYLPSLGLPMWQHALQGVPIGLFLLYYAILAHRLMDITIIIRKTLVYSVVMGSLTIVYLSAIAIFAKIFQGFSGYQTVFSPALAAGLITVCFQPLRKRVQAFVDAKFFRQYVDREEKLYELSREVITHTTPEAMAQALIRVLADTLHPKAGVLYLKSRDNSGYSPVAHWGEISSDRMSEDSPLARYFADHPQPFVQDMPADLGQSRSTRVKTERGEAA